MSSSNPEESTDPDQGLTPDEIHDLNRLEAIAQRRLGTYLLVGSALSEIRDRHLYRGGQPSFETYLRERWGLNSANGAPLSEAAIRTESHAAPSAEPAPRKAPGSKPCEALARACEQTLSALDVADRVSVEIRFAPREQRDPGALADGPSFDPSAVTASIGDGLIPTLRWLLTQASGTIGEVAHQLEARAADIDDGTRAKLRDDILVLDGELAVVKGLLAELVDWDSELEQLLKDELPPLDTDTDPDDEE